MNHITRRLTSIVLAGAILTGGGAVAAFAQSAGSTPANPDNTPSFGIQVQEVESALHAAIATAITSTMNITLDELKASHATGASDSELAVSKGTDRQALIDAIVAALKANRPAGSPDRTDAELIAKANELLDNTHAKKPGHTKGAGGQQTPPPAAARQSGNSGAQSGGPGGPPPPPDAGNAGQAQQGTPPAGNDQAPPSGGQSNGQGGSQQAPPPVQ